MGVAVGQLSSHNNVEDGGRGTAEGGLPWALEHLGPATAMLRDLGQSLLFPGFQHLHLHYKGVGPDPWFSNSLHIGILWGSLKNYP